MAGVVSAAARCAHARGIVREFAERGGSVGVAVNPLPPRPEDRSRAVLDLLKAVPRLQRVPFDVPERRGPARAGGVPRKRDGQWVSAAAPRKPRNTPRPADDMETERAVRRVWRQHKSVLQGHATRASQAGLNPESAAPLVRKLIADGCKTYDAAVARGAAGVNSLNALLELLLLAGDRTLFRRYVMGFADADGGRGGPCEDDGGTTDGADPEEERERQHLRGDAAANAGGQRVTPAPLFPSEPQLYEWTRDWNLGTYELGIRYCAAIRDLPTAQLLYRIAPRASREVATATLSAMVKADAPLAAGLEWIEMHTVLQGDPDVYAHVVRMCASRDDCHHLLSVMAAAGVQRTPVMYTILLKQAKRLRDVGFAEAIAKELNAEGAATPEHVAALMSCYASVGRFDSLQRLLASCEFELSTMDFAHVVRACSRADPSPTGATYGVAEAFLRQGCIAGLLSTHLLDAAVYLYTRARAVEPLTAFLSEAAAAGVLLPGHAAKSVRRWYAQQGLEVPEAALQAPVVAAPGQHMPRDRPRHRGGESAPPR